MIEKIVKRDGRVVPFDRERMVFAVYRAAIAVGGRDRSEAARVTDEVIRLLERRQDPQSYPTVEEVQDLVEKVLIERGHARTAKAYIVYRYEHALKRLDRKSLVYSPDNIPYQKLWEALSWGVDRGCVTLAQMAEMIERGSYPEMVRWGEEYYARELERVAEKLQERLPEIRVVIIAGPSSSGKTTTTFKVGEILRQKGFRLLPLAVDNYFFDLEEHPRDPMGDYDFETPQALDLALINEHMERLLAGQEVAIPFYNFKTGKREPSRQTLKLETGHIILIDSLHGLYPEMTRAVAEESKFKIYIETLSQLKDREQKFIRWADIRLLRRMVRDMQFRAYSPKETIRHWHHVRRSELRYIVPRLREADALVNSFLLYELPIMKHRLGGRFPGFLEEFRDNPDRSDAYERAERVTALFQEVPAWEDESVIPGDALLREFIGGSTLIY